MKIVLTGGPSAGKTVIAETLLKAFWNQVLLVQESASLLFRGGFPRKTSMRAMTCQQRAIYHVQRELEELATLESGSEHYICDRGTLDGLAFWPGSEEEFFAQINSTKKDELARYDWVLHLETASLEAYIPSALRTENYKEAVQINQKLKDVWRDHYRRIIIPESEDFSKKIKLAHAAVSMILSQKSLQEVVASLRNL